MQYQALYRKYRPQRFDEVIGQDHVTATLEREVVEDKVAHAYLFTGPRGTGKTTTARLLAKSLNCPNRATDGEPCNTCPSCESVTDGTSLDVIELDAASHNKVEDVREIRVNVGTVAAAAGARRVYILDEAHMLSRAAGNALLKTLEEPPAHVVFVLATTEPYKLLDTIRSRSQRFDFHPVATETLIDYLATISDKEGFTYDHGALGAVTSHAGGSVRDAMSLLEQVAALGSGSVTTAGVEQALGLADAESFGRMVDAIIEADAAAALALVAELSRQGADLRRFVADAIGYLRGVFLAQYAPNVDEVVDASRETITQWQATANRISSAEVLRSIDELSTALLQIREGREERLVVEIAAIRLTRPEVAVDVEAITARLARLEREMKHRPAPAAPPAPPAAELPADRPFARESRVADDEPRATSTESRVASDESRATGSEQRVTSDESAAPTPEARDSQPESRNSESFDLYEFEQIWPKVVATIRDEVGPRRHALLREAAPVAVEDGTVVFEVAPHMHFHLEQLKSDSELSGAMAAAAAHQLGQPVKITYRAGQAPSVEAAEEEERAPEMDTLVEAEDSDAGDPETIVTDLLGATLVSDTTSD